MWKKYSNIDRQKKKKKKKKEKVQLTKDDAFLYWSSSCAVCWWPIFRKLGTCSTTDALSPRTLLTENICESVQQILQHSPAKRKRKKKRFNSPKIMPFFTGPLPVQCDGGRFSGSLAHAPRICESVQEILQLARQKKLQKKKKNKTLNSPNMMPFFTGLFL